MNNFVWVTELTDPFFYIKEIEAKIPSGEPIVLYTKAKLPPHLLKIIYKSTNVAISYTITGWGGTWLEPCVPNTKDMVKHINSVMCDLDPKRIRLRIDPVIPTVEGMIRAGAVAMFIENHINIITSILQLYKSHEEMACRLGIDLSHYTITSGRAKFVKEEVTLKWLNYLYRIASWTIGQVQFCGMPYPVPGAIHQGCIDLTLLEAIGANVPIILQGKQRPGCKCIVNKKQIVQGKCGHSCIYCYAHKENLKHLKGDF